MPILACPTEHAHIARCTELLPVLLPFELLGLPSRVG
jgi:hypothetical protein